MLKELITLAITMRRVAATFRTGLPKIILEFPDDHSLHIFQCELCQDAKPFDINVGLELDPVKAIPARIAELELELRLKCHPKPWRGEPTGWLD